jgi:FkbM family methyltransferase
VPERAVRRNRWCVFTSAGDHNNVFSWVADSEEREWDLIVAFYGSNEGTFDRLRHISRAVFRLAGSKLQNLKKLFDRQPGIFAQYDFIWVADDDLMVAPADIGRLFDIASQYDFWICQPAFSSRGRISHPITRWGGSDSSIRLVNFVEITCPLFRKDRLEEFLGIYDGELVGWGIDWWYCNHFQAERYRKLAIIDEVTVTNPHDHQRAGGEREIVKLQSDEMRYERWLETAQNLHLLEYEPRTLAQIRKDPVAGGGSTDAAAEDVLAAIKRDLPRKADQVIIDVGANAGQWTLRCARQFPQARIHALEPVPDTFRKLSSAVKAFPNIQLHCTALGREWGELPLLLAEDPTMSRFAPTASTDRTTVVRVVTLAEFCRDHDIGPIDLLKIDTAGHDLEVIVGAEEVLDRVDFLQCVVSANPHNRFHASFEEVLQHLRGRGFSVYRICDQTMEWTGGGYPLLRRLDCVFVNARVVGPLRNVLDR